MCTVLETPPGDGALLPALRLRTQTHRGATAAREIDVQLSTALSPADPSGRLAGLHLPAVFIPSHPVRSTAGNDPVQADRRSGVPPPGIARPATALDRPAGLSTASDRASAPSAASAPL